MHHTIFFLLPADISKGNMKQTNGVTNVNIAHLKAIVFKNLKLILMQNIQNMVKRNSFVIIALKVSFLKGH